MTSRERLINSIKHKQIDKLPVDLSATRASSLTVPPCVELMNYLGVKEYTPKLYDVKMFLPFLPEEIKQHFKIDTEGVFRQKTSMGLRAGGEKRTMLNGYEVIVPDDYRVKEIGAGKLTFLDEFGNIVAEKPESGLFFEMLPDPNISGDNYEEAIENLSPQTFMFDEREKAYILEETKKARETTDRAVINALWMNVFERGNALRGFQNMLMDIASEDKYAEMLFEKITDGYVANIDWFLKNADEYSDVICLSDDMGTQLTTLMSPEMYRKQLKPFHKKIIDKIKSISPDKIVFMHSCGAISSIIPDFIEIGIDVLNPVQISASGMNPERLKREFGKDISFWGGAVDSQYAIMTETPDVIRRETIKNIESFMKGGGYVCSSSHNFQPNVPLDNILAFFNAINEVNGEYKF